MNEYVSYSSHVTRICGKKNAYKVSIKNILSKCPLNDNFQTFSKNMRCEDGRQLEPDLKVGGRGVVEGFGNSESH